MLTIGQLASFAGVTVRTVRHYHATGLLPEPSRNWSGYRTYPASAAVELVRIRTLAEAGVPLSRVRELLAADEEEFAVAVEEVDRRLRAEIRERQRHRARIAQLAAGESLALPTEAVAYLERMRALGLPERLVEIERDSWILIAAQLPEEIPALMEYKHHQLDDQGLRELYLAMADVADCAPGDPRLPDLADRVAAFVEAASALGEQAVNEGAFDPAPVSPELAALLDQAFVESIPAAPQLLRLLEERGWVGWTEIRRVGA